MTTSAVFEVEVPMIRIEHGKPPVPPLNGNDRIHYHTRAQRVGIVRRVVMDNARDAGIPVCEHLTVTLHYAPGDNRRRDADNLWPTLKAACDALARGPRRDWVGLELVPDDTPEHMTKLAPVIHPGPGVRRLWLTVEVTR